MYSSVLNTYNGRDQVTLSFQFAGTTSRTTYQDTTASYDGFGRKVGQKLPQQDSPGTAFTYNPDGSVLTQTDARGVVTNFEYNNRGLTTGITWDVGTTGITDTSDVEFEYDNIGNRTEMTDGLGTQVYEYDALSRLIAEIREFDDTLANAPISGNKFRLEYSYHMGGQLKSLTDPYGQQFNYAYDRVSRLESVTGSTSFAGFTDYASNAQYRAWGALKGLDSGNGVSMQTSFDAALRPSEYELKYSANDTAMERSYEYYNDGALKYMEDHMSPKFDRFNRYDHQGRITQGKPGLEARGGSVTDPEVQKLELPYRQSYQYNAFNNMTQRLNLHWGSDSFGQSNFNLNYTYENNRVTNSWWQHDADGRVTQSALPDDYSGNTYDARGSLIKMQVQPEGMNATETTRFYSGDARELKRSIRRQMDEEDPPYGSYWEDDPPKYYVRSSVLGGEVITQTDETGRKTKTNVIAAGAKIVTQNVTFGESGPVETVWFHHGDSSGMSSRSSWHNGLVNPTDGIDGAPAETDPMGANVGQSDPYVEIIIFDPPEWYPEPYFPNFGDSTMMVNGMSVPCTLDGMTINCSTALGMMASGSAIPAHLAGWQRYSGFDFNSHGLGINTVTLPDLWTNNSGAVWGTSPGASGQEGWRFFEGGTSIYSINWAPQRQSQQQESQNMRNFRNAVQAIRNILNQNGGDNPCANFFGGPGLDALEKIVGQVTDETFTDMGENSTGIRMGIPIQVSLGGVELPSQATAVSNLDGTRAEIPARYVSVSPVPTNDNPAVSINTRGPFVSPFAPRVGGYASGTLRSRVSQLLHEMAHITVTDVSRAIRVILIGNEPRSYEQLKLTHRIPPDTNNPSLSARNTNTVLDACRDQINALRE